MYVSMTSASNIWSLTTGFKDPRFAGIRQAYDEVGFRDKKNNIWLGWSANFLIAREVVEEYHDPFVAYPELSFTEIVDPKLKAWYEC